MTTSALQRLAALPAAWWRAPMLHVFLVFMALFPIGYGWREVMPSLAGLLLLVFYARGGWRDSVLRTSGVLPFFCCLWGMVAIGVIFSTDPLASLLHAGTGLNKGFILPLAAMECLRDERDLRRLTWACLSACVWQGLDGVWQAATGADFVMGYVPVEGRLTGSFDDYEGGNYIALALLPAMGAWFLIRRRLAPGPAAAVFALALLPGLFLLVGASARSGLLAVLAGIALWLPLSGRLRPRAVVAALAAGGVLAAVFGLFAHGRLSQAAVAGDGRWSLWLLAWEVFREHPWFGAGAGRYNAAFRALGLVPEKDAITISHPHDLYLDILCAHGIAGFILGMTFLLGILVWGWRRIVPALRAELAMAAAHPGASCHWRLTVCFWIAHAAWLVNGIFGHDFYRTWWLALSMSHMGAMIGAVHLGMRRAREGGAEAPAVPPDGPPGGSGKNPPTAP